MITYSQQPIHDAIKRAYMLLSEELVQTGGVIHPQSRTYGEIYHILCPWMSAGGVIIWMAALDPRFSRMTNAQMSKARQMYQDHQRLGGKKDLPFSPTRK
jgi:hypothetical protein